MSGTRTKDKNRAAARRKGNAFEGKIEKILDGTKWRGEDGDVEARGYRIECKFRTGKEIGDIPNAELASWYAQMKRYEDKNPGVPFLLAYSGGREAGNRIWIAMPIEHFIKMDDQIEDAKALQHYREKYPEKFERISALLLEIVADMMEEE